LKQISSASTACTDLPTGTSVHGSRPRSWCARAQMIRRRQVPRSAGAWGACTPGLIAKIPRTHRWRVTNYGRNVMGASMYLREHHFPNVYSGVTHW